MVIDVQAVILPNVVFGQFTSGTDFSPTVSGHDSMVLENHEDDSYQLTTLSSFCTTQERTFTDGVVHRHQLVKVGVRGHQRTGNQRVVTRLVERGFDAVSVEQLTTTHPCFLGGIELVGAVAGQPLLIQLIHGFLNTHDNRRVSQFILVLEQQGLEYLVCIGMRAQTAHSARRRDDLCQWG